MEASYPDVVDALNFVGEELCCECGFFGNGEVSCSCCDYSNLSPDRLFWDLTNDEELGFWVVVSGGNLSDDCFCCFFANFSG